MGNTDSRLLKNALYLFTGVVIANAGSFIFRILIAQEYGSSGFGLVSIGLMITSIATTISLFGLSDGMINFVPRYRENGNFGQILGTIITGFSISLGIAILLTVLLISTSTFIANDIFGTDNLTKILIWMSLIIPANILIRLSSAVSLGFERGGYRVFIKQSLPKIILLVFTAIAIAFGVKIIEIGKVYALSMWCAAIFGIILLFNIVPISKAKTITADPQRLISFSAPLMFASTAGFFLNWIDTAIVGIFLTESKVGIYQSAFLIGSHVSIFIGAIAGSLYPNFGALLESKSFDVVQKRHSQGRRWGFLLTIAPIVYLLFFPKHSLQFIFGTGFGQGANSLRLILASQFTNILLGPITNLLKSLEESRYVFKSYVLGGVINLILNLILVPKYGITGAAISTSIAAGLVDISHFHKANQQIGLNWFDSDLAIACGAAVIAAVPSLVVANQVGELFQFGAHILLFSSVYICSLFLLGGIDQYDIRYLYNNIQ